MYNVPRGKNILGNMTKQRLILIRIEKIIRLVSLPLRPLCMLDTTGKLFESLWQTICEATKPPTRKVRGRSHRRSYQKYCSGTARGPLLQKNVPISHSAPNSSRWTEKVSKLQAIMKFRPIYIRLYEVTGASANDIMN